MMQPGKSEPMNIAFVYRNKSGEEKQHELRNWKEVGHYVEGWCVVSDGFKTFRKDRVVQYLGSAETILSDPYPPKAAISKEAKADQYAPQILFTGFPASQRADLERRATESGMDVRKTVTLGLNFLCYGPTAGPTKVRKAMEQRVYLMDQAQFLILLDTGELPDVNELHW